MWFADFYSDLEWIAERKGDLGAPRFKLHGPVSRSLKIKIEFLFFGDEYNFRHLRVMMHTDDKATASTCLDLNVQSWVTALEIAVMVITNKPFHVAIAPGQSEHFVVTLAQGNEDTPAAVIGLKRDPDVAINYEQVAYAFAAWPPEVRPHSFYFRRLIDKSLPIDVRWLNGYRFLEWHFVREKGRLYKNSEWRTLLSRFDEELRPSLCSNQTAVGLMEEARALAAHAGYDKRSDAARAREPHNAMEKTIDVLGKMAITVIQEHPARAGNPVQFLVRGTK